MSKGFVYYQLPNSSEIIGFSGEWTILEKIDKIKSGFVVTTFNKDKIYNLTKQNEISISEFDFRLPNEQLANFEISKKEYLQMIEDTKAYCQSMNGKVVISRVKKKEISDDFNVKEVFLKLCEKYQHSFNYLCFIPEEGMWMGASPEKLLFGDVNFLKLVSLAGSKDDSQEIIWSKKEKFEQQLVTDAIEKILLNLDLNFKKSATKTTKAGNMFHLETEFEVSNCNHFVELANQLHPTPAVSGFPKDKALDFIVKNEKHQRNLYAGIIGNLDKDKVQLYVNLRCAKITGNQIELYVGGGITSESDANSEWNETEFKSNTLLSVLEN